MMLCFQAVQLHSASEQIKPGMRLLSV